MNLRLHTQPHNHTDQGYHIYNTRVEQPHRGDLLRLLGHCWAYKEDEEPAINFHAQILVTKAQNILEIKK